MFDESSYFRKLKNPFAMRGDPLSAEDVAMTFAIPERCMDVIHQPFHYRIEGHLGSGKTMLLRANSFASRSIMEEIDPNKAEKIFKSDFMGIYLSFNKENVSIFYNENNNRLFRNLFLLWFEAQIAYQWFDSTITYLKLKRISHEKIIKSIRKINNILQIDTFTTAFKSIPSLVNFYDELSQICRLSVNVDGEIKFLKQYVNLENSIQHLPLPDTFVNSIIDLTVAEIPDIIKILPCFLLLDSFENLNEDFQYIVNNLFSWKIGQKFFTKACSLPGGFKTTRLSSGREYIVPDEVKSTEIRWNCPSAEYNHFCIQVLKNHLQRFSQINSHIEIETNPRILFQSKSIKNSIKELLLTNNDDNITEEIRKLLGPNYSDNDESMYKFLFHKIFKSGGRNSYSGLDEFIALSSGNIRLLSRLCEWSFQEESFIINSNKYKIVSIKSQEKASNYVSDEMYNRRLRTTTHEYEREVRGILVLFFNRLVALHSESANSSTWKNLTISTNDDSQLSFEPILEEAINKATQAGILLPIKRSHNSVSYAIPTIYAPIKNLNFNIEGFITFSVDEIAKSAAPSIMRKSKNKKELQIELFNLPLQNPNVFISTPDTDKARDFLSKHIKKVVEKKFSGRLLQFSEAENLILTDAIMDVIGKRSSIVFCDITRFRPNVMFEYGVALSLKKALQPLYNNSNRKYDPTKMPEIFQGIRVLRYNSRTSKSSHFEDIIFKFIERWQKNITHPLVCPVQSKCPFEEIYEEEVISVFPLSNRKETLEWKEEEFSIIKKHLNSISKFKIEMPLENTNPKLCRVCTRCKLVRKSSHTIIELNKNDAENALVLGLAFGHGKTITAISRGSEDNIPSCWRGKSAIKYNSGDELQKALRQLIT